LAAPPLAKNVTPLLEGGVVQADLDSLGGSSASGEAGNFPPGIILGRKILCKRAG
jgi:hypothetical protein